MLTALVTHEACLLHDPGPGHPETAARLASILTKLNEAGLPGLRRMAAPEVDQQILRQVHAPEYVANVFARVAASPIWNLDPDTIVSSHSGEAILRAAGSICLAIDQIMAGDVLNAFCAVRPPGHHATRGSSGGFCIFNNVAIGAAWARHRHSLRRIAIIDFDVHHGNGTQSLFWDDPDTLFVSVHRSPFDPWSGSSDETGRYNNVLNLPVPASTTGVQLRHLMQDSVSRRIADFSPELILVSAGFDGHKDDPLGGLQLETSDFGWLGNYLASVADSVCQGRLVAVLEGGYNIEATGESALSFVRALEQASSSYGD